MVLKLPKKNHIINLYNLRNVVGGDDWDDLHWDLRGSAWTWADGGALGPFKEESLLLKVGIYILYIKGKKISEKYICGPKSSSKCKTYSIFALTLEKTHHYYFDSLVQYKFPLWKQQHASLSLQSLTKLKFLPFNILYSLHLK